MFKKVEQLNWNEVKLPNGFYYCRNQNQLDSLLKSLEIDKNKCVIIADIRHYPCLVTIEDNSLECGKVFIYSITKEDIDKIKDFL